MSSHLDNDRCDRAAEEQSECEQLVTQHTPETHSGRSIDQSINTGMKQPFVFDISLENLKEKFNIYQEVPVGVK